MSGESREKALCEAFTGLLRGHCGCCSCHPPDEPYGGRGEWPWSCSCGADEQNAKIEAFIKDFGLEEWL